MVFVSNLRSSMLPQNDTNATHRTFPGGGWCLRGRAPPRAPTPAHMRPVPASLPVPCLTESPLSLPGLYGHPLSLSLKVNKTRF